MSELLSIKMYKGNLIRFFDLILGALTEAPSKLAPVMKIPHAAPKIESPRASPIPTYAQE